MSASQAAAGSAAAALARVTETEEVLARSFMSRALNLAERGRSTTHPNPRVGCVIVRDGVIVGEGWHARAGEPHAEAMALREAGERARGAEIYVNLEPCAHHGRTPPCADALVAAGVRRVWAALEDPNPQVAGRGAARLRAAGIAVHIGVGAERATRLNRGFLLRMSRGRPWVTLKLAASLDGRTAMASGESRWITGEEARTDVHRLRAEAGAVMSSSATVLADDPLLDVRLYRRALQLPDPGTPAELRPVPREPDRIVLDSRQRVPREFRVWRPGARRFLVTGSAQTASAAEGVEVLRVPLDAHGHVDLAAALQALGRSEINEVFVECGPHLAGAFLASGLTDELVVYLAPSLLGHEAQPLAFLPGLERLSQRLDLVPQDVRMVGADVRITSTLRRKEGPTEG
jgi:diaminohydroxyphosphoribosylaminopyrimidine deaminase/5-amino-6-(5-phosphoribosylamino)uracil reductase